MSKSIFLIIFTTLMIVTGCKELGVPTAVETELREVPKSSHKVDENLLLKTTTQSCEDEVKKDKPNIQILQNICFIEGVEAEKSKNYSESAWYYVLSTNYQESLRFVDSKALEGDNVAIYANVGHSLMLDGQYEKAQEYFRYLAIKIEDFEGMNKALLSDFVTLKKIYPQKKFSIEKGKRIWEKVYETKKEQEKTYNQYLEFETYREFKKTLPYLDKLIALEEKNVKYASNILYYKGVKAHHTQNYKEAITFLKQAKKEYKFKKVCAEEYSYILSWLSESYSELGEYKKALFYRDQYTQLMIDIFGKEHSYVAVGYDFTGLIYEIQSKYKKAMEYYEKSLAIKENYKPRDERQIASTLAKISGIYYSTGEYAKSLRYLQEVVAVNEKVLPPDSKELATNYNNLGTFYGKLGNNEKALEYYLKSLKIRRKVLGERDKYTVLLYSEIGVLYKSLKKFKLSEEYHLKAIANYEDKYGIYAQEISYSYQALGELYIAQKRYDLAIKYLKKAVDIKEGLTLPKELKLADTYASLASAYLYNHQNDLALTYLEKDYELKKSILGEENSLVQKAKLRISSLNGNYDDAYVKSKKVFENFLKERELYFSVLSDNEKALYLKKSKESIYHLLGTTTHSTQNQEARVKETFTAWLRYKGVLFDEENSINILYEQTSDNNIKQEIDSLLKNKRKLANLYQNGGEKRVEIEQLKATIDASMSRLREQSQSIKRLQVLKNIEYKDVAETLKENELYIDYAKVRDYYFIFTVDSNADVTLEQLSKRASQSIDKAVLSFRTKVKRKRDSKTERSMLFEYLLKDKIASKEKLIISSDGLLRFLPFETLFDKEADKFLIESREVSYISSGKELVRLVKYAEQGSNSKVVIFSNPDFNAPISSSSRKMLNGRVAKAFSELKGTKAEAVAIKTILAGEEIVNYEGKEANELNLLNIQAPKVLHIATHGFFTARKQPNPMLNSGIALSGANRSIRTGKSEGIITALKLSGLKLKATELVVLSACETGVMSMDSSENLSGLSKAFIEAGAKNVVMSLWSVSDMGTKELMQLFYKGIKESGDYRKSLRDAKVEMIKQGVPIFIWSPFILNGV